MDYKHIMRINWVLSENPTVRVDLDSPLDSVSVFIDRTLSKNTLFKLMSSQNHISGYTNFHKLWIIPVYLQDDRVSWIEEENLFHFFLPQSTSRTEGAVQMACIISSMINAEA